MGLRYVKSGRTVTVYPSDLKGGEVTAPDLRGGAALIVAALAAEGETVIKGDACIDRGYEAIERKLFNLGASVHRDQR